MSCAGGISPATAPRAVAAGARIIICGGAITKAPDNRAAAAAMLAAVASGVAPEQTLYRRAGLAEVRAVLARVSTPNLSDAMHRGGALRGFVNRNPAVRLCGPAATVLTVAGDWSKPVQAIDACKPGDVLVIDAGDQYPALWGGLASRTAVQRGLGGVVIRGAAATSPTSPPRAWRCGAPRPARTPANRAASARSACRCRSAASRRIPATGWSATRTAWSSSPPARWSRSPTAPRTSSSASSAWPPRSPPARPWRRSRNSGNGSS